MATWGAMADVWRCCRRVLQGGAALCPSPSAGGRSACECAPSASTRCWKRNRLWSLAVLIFASAAALGPAGTCYVPCSFMCYCNKVAICAHEAGICWPPRASGACIKGKHSTVTVKIRRIVQGTLVGCGMICCAHLLLAEPAAEADASRDGPGAARAAAQECPTHCRGRRVRVPAWGRAAHRGGHERGREGRCGIAGLLSAAACAGCGWLKAGGGGGVSPWRAG